MFVKGMLGAVVMLLSVHVATAQDATPPPAPKATVQSLTNALRALVPAGVTVDEAHAEGDVYVFTGGTPTNALLSDFMRRTDSSPGFEDIELREIAQAGTQYRYVMSVGVDCSAAGAAKPGAVCGPPAKPQSVYKCRIGGTLTFQAAPCPAGSEAR